MADNPDKEMEKLSRAIVEAILNSSDVKKSLTNLQHIDEKNAKSMMVFILRLDLLSDFKETDFTGFIDEEKEEQQVIQEREKPKKRKTRIKHEKPEIIDGKLVTKSEKKFLDFLSENFNSEDWLKQNKISLD